MSGGSQHNPNGRQSQLGPGWSPLQVANFLARAPQVHMASDRGVTWHTPTPPPHLYHVPAPSPPDPLQAMKNAGGNSVFRHTATPPELYRHTPTPPDKHLMRHTPSPGDVKAGAPMPPTELYPHLGPGRDKLVRPEDLLAYARVGVDLSLAGARAANGSPAPHPASPALSVRDAPTINSLIARAQPRHGHARVDALLERLVPSPASPHSVIVHSRAAPTPSPPSSNEDSADSCGAPPGSKRKRKPERTIRVPSAPPPAPAAASAEPAAPPARHEPPQPAPPAPARKPSPTHPPAPIPQPSPPKPIENGEVKTNGPEKPPSPPPERPARRKTRSGSAETIDDIAAMIASTDRAADPPLPPPVPATPTEPPVTVDNLKSVLASPEPKAEPEVRQSPPQIEEKPPEAPPVEAAAAPRRRSARTSNSESANVPVDSPSEGKPAEPDTQGCQSAGNAAETPTAEPTAAFVEVENQLEKMFAGIEEEPMSTDKTEDQDKPTAKAKKRRKSAPTKGERKAARRASRASTDEGGLRRKAARKKEAGKAKKKESVRDAYDSGSNASSSRSRGPYIQIRGPRDSPLSVSVINASTGEEDGDATLGRRKGGEEFRNGLRARGLHASTLGLRYDATTPDVTWLCVFCERGPHAAGLGDLFGPYTVDTDCEEFRALDEATRRRYTSGASPCEVWLHAACGVWAPGLVAAGARLWGLAGAVWGARGGRCCACARPPAPLACAKRACKARAHLPCARTHNWHLDDDTFRALCPTHAQEQ
ncbi:hypothetical protein ABMA27_014451 [Loxostege sticticalis]|uniref:PHD-type domain-containing protein n=1 Tax=Loxostege sticticalis TaxID=481309 RepID=A0ABR3I8Z0_LOXSC